jgi:hypothetical protein
VTIPTDCSLTLQQTMNQNLETHRCSRIQPWDLGISNPKATTGPDGLSFTEVKWMIIINVSIWNIFFNDPLFVHIKNTGPGSTVTLVV